MALGFCVPLLHNALLQRTATEHLLCAGPEPGCFLDLDLSSTLQGILGWLGSLISIWAEWSKGRL